MKAPHVRGYLAVRVCGLEEAQGPGWEGRGEGEVQGSPLTGEPDTHTVTYQQLTPGLEQRRHIVIQQLMLCFVSLKWERGWAFRIENICEIVRPNLEIVE